jgi:proteasome activator subunit 4
MVAPDAADVIAPPPPVQADMDLASETAIGAQKIEKQMHVYNAWLPHFMVAEVKEEPQRFHKLVATMREEMLCFTSPADRVATLAWIPVINSFVKAKIDLENQDLEAVIGLGLKFLLETSDNLFIQDRWARCLSRILQTKDRKLDLKIQWLPLYSLLVTTHFKRRYSYEGLKLKSQHLESIATLVRCCRRYFPPTSAVEIWREFRYVL